MTVREPAELITGAWSDPRLSPVERAAALLAVLTPQEKLQQLGSSWPGSENMEEAVAPLQDSHLLALPFDDAIVDGLGHLTRPFGTAPIDPAEGVQRLAAFQNRVVSANRFGIPAIVHEECLTGLTAWRATVYPTPLAWAATFDPAIVTKMAAAIGADMASLGVHQGLAPVLDIVRDYRWGRVEETLGEDPYLVSEMASSYVVGLQSSGVVATLKHFAGYSASRGARNHAPVSSGERELRDVLLIPFEKAVAKAGVRSVMNSYTELDGVPSASDEWLLTDVLRNEWGFTGTVVSDYWAIGFLKSMHRIVDTFTDAGVLSLRAGIDVELPHTLAYTSEISEGPAAEWVDRAVLRVLTQKAELGLLDSGWTPEGVSSPQLDTPVNRELARTVAERSVVLLHNEQALLPLYKHPQRIAVIGPVADDAGCLFGCYSFPNHVLPNFPEVELGIAAPTILDAVRATFPDSIVQYERGAEILNSSTEGVAAAVAAAAAADVVLLFVGDRSGMFGHGSSGEGCDVLDLKLPGSQEDLVEAVLATGTAVVLVTVSGRPYAIGHHARRAAAALQAFLPGQEGAAAIAGILAGDVHPSGRLPVQIPGDASAQPGTYLAPTLALRSDGVSNIDPTPAYPFGHGLTYSTVSIDQADVASAAVRTDGVIEIAVTVTNSGPRRATAVPQVYLADPVAEVTRPVRQLVGFHRVDLEPGHTAVVEFDISADLASYTDRRMRRRVEPGELTIIVADSAADEGHQLSIHLVGEIRYVDHRRTMSSVSRLRSSGSGADHGLGDIGAPNPTMANSLGGA